MNKISLILPMVAIVLTTTAYAAKPEHAMGKTRIKPVKQERVVAKPLIAYCYPVDAMGPYDYDMEPWARLMYKGKQGIVQVNAHNLEMETEYPLVYGGEEIATGFLNEEGGFRIRTAFTQEGEVVVEEFSVAGYTCGVTRLKGIDSMKEGLEDMYIE